MSEELFRVWHSVCEQEDFSPHGDFAAVHGHNMHELILVKSGVLNVKINEKEYVVPPKSLVIMSNIEMHLLTPIEFPYERYGLQVSIPAMKKIPLNISYFSILANHPPHFNNVFDLSNCFEEFETLFKGMEAECDSSVCARPSRMLDEYSNDIMRFKISELLLMLKRKFPERFTQHKNKSDCTILQIQQYIDSNFAKDISINELAKEAFISHTSFINAFKKITGYSPKHYLLMCRLAEAKSLLSSTSLTISDIAFKIGFKDSNSFIRFFRQELGLTPGEYRKINYDIS